MLLQHFFAVWVVITHDGIRAFMSKNAITTQIKFTDENKFYMITDNNSRLIIFYKLKDNYLNELTAEAFLKALIEIKEFCIDKQITQF